MKIQLSQKWFFLAVWFKYIFLARTDDIIKHMLTILKLQGWEWKQHENSFNEFEQFEC